MSIRISPAEWEVLNVLWDKAPATATEIYAALPDRTTWHQKTVNTFLDRLVKKGVLTAEREGKANLYAPMVTKESCVQAESHSFLHRVFGGAFQPMMAHFVENADLSETDIAELQRLLKQRAKKGGSK